MLLVAVTWGLIVLMIAGFVYEQFSRSRDRRRSIPGRLLEMDGYRLHMTDLGTGDPTVVVLHGAGDSSYSWLHVTREVSRFTRVVVYDRPGLGSSDPGPSPDASRSVDELHDLLTRAGVPGPYLLVGHSLGGLIARLFAIRFPDQVTGLVMVDSSHEFLKDDAKFRQGFAFVGAMLKVFRLLSVIGLPRFLGQAFGLMPMYPERFYFARQLSREDYEDWKAAFYRNVIGDGGLQEFAAALPIIEVASRQMTDGTEGPQFGDTPLVVLTNPGFGEAWVEMHRQLAGRSSSSIHRISERKGHNIQMTSPDLVVDSIRQVVEQARRRVITAD